MLGIFFEYKTNEKKLQKEKIGERNINYEVLRDGSYVNKNGVHKRTIDILIPYCDITKKEMTNNLLPKLAQYAKNYSLWIRFYCDRRFYKLYDGATNGSVSLREDGTISTDSLKFHKTNELMTDKEISIYTEYQKLTGTSKNSTDEEKRKFEEEERNLLKKYNITEEELMEINSKGFSFTL